MDLGYDDGYLTTPVTSGDTLYTLSLLTGREADDAGPVLPFRMVGLRDLTPSAAWDRYGDALFETERKKNPEDRIGAKCFEVTRRLLCR